ncbi:MAG: polyprenyl diphosphate synthase [Rectinema sp.]|nr:polyprenyl diphosphate synthase [Rectinema sp.]
MNDKRVPDHVAIIMDGNGRWAKSKGLPRTEGHRRGLETAKVIVKAARDAGIRFLSLYTFSTENWKRAQEEVGFLMSLLRTHLSRELDFYRQNGIRIVHSGARDGLPSDVLEEIDRAIEATAQFKGIVVNLAINYGGRDEIMRAIGKMLQADPAPAPLQEASIRAMLDHPELPDPDLIIRTGGEYRLSNFLLWQSAYSELYFSSKFWPDFGPDDLQDALRDYARRERRFGDAR